MNNLLIHIHGFLSSNDADRVAALREYIKASDLDVDVISPQLPNAPRLAIELIEKIIDEEKASRRSIALIGHSLGGYLATYIASKYQLRAVLVNPVVRGYEIMCEFFGECYNPHTGERFEIGEADIEYLASLHLEKIPNPSLFLVMQQLGDEITDPGDALDYYRQCKLVIENGGCHDFSHFESHAETVVSFLFGTVEHH